MFFTFCVGKNKGMDERIFGYSHDPAVGLFLGLKQ